MSNQTQKCGSTNSLHTELDKFSKTLTQLHDQSKKLFVLYWRVHTKRRKREEKIRFPLGGFWKYSHIFENFEGMRISLCCMYLVFLCVTNFNLKKINAIVKKKMCIK
jgi:hypothetical protein